MLRGVRIPITVPPAGGPTQSPLEWDRGGGTSTPVGSCNRAKPPPRGGPRHVKGSFALGLRATSCGPPGLDAPIRVKRSWRKMSKVQVAARVPVLKWPRETGLRPLKVVLNPPPPGVGESAPVTYCSSLLICGVVTPNLYYLRDRECSSL